MQCVKNTYNGKSYTALLLIVTLYGTYWTFTGSIIMFGFPFLLVWGLLQGIFNGMLVAAFVEVLHVFAMITMRLGLRDIIRYLMMAVVFGKIAGSLFQWLYLAK